VPIDQIPLPHRLVGDDPDVLAAAETTGAALILSAAAMLTGDAGHFVRAANVTVGARGAWIAGCPR
jgi:hypothetical protein